MDDNLGRFIKEKINIHINKTKKRKADIIKEFEITTQYLHDIENSKRIPSPYLMKKMIKVLELDDSESIKLYDLASEGHKEKRIPADIEEFINKNDEIKNKIREMIKKQKEEYKYE